MKTIDSHYVRINLKGDGKFEIWLVEETFDLGEYMKAQVEWAVKDLLNRNGVNEEYHQNFTEKDFELKENQIKAVNHFLANNGAEWFEKNLRPKFIKNRHILLDCTDPNCPFSIIQNLCKKCPDCKLAKLGIEPEETPVSPDGSDPKN